MVDKKHTSNVINKINFKQHNGIKEKKLKRSRRRLKKMKIKAFLNFYLFNGGVNSKIAEE